MKKKLITRLVKIIALTTSLIVTFNFISPNFLEKSTVRAIGDLTVDWGVTEGDPIFVVNNMTPGQVESRNVDITNGGSGIRPIGVRSEIVDDTDGLSSMMDFKISEGGSDLYGGLGPTGPKTLADFFTEGVPLNGIFLSNLNAGANITYTFTATFKPEAENEFQNTQVIFDIIIGISVDIPDECEQLTFSGSPIFGTSQGDNLKGTSGNDLIIGFEKGDSIDGKGGDDCILGGPGADSLKGGEGNDFVFGNEDHDSIKGGSGVDLLVGGSGHDSLHGEGHNDKLIGEDGDDSLNGDGGEDELLGGDGKDSLKGGGQNDMLIGGAGLFDSANGNGGTDKCEAESETNCELNP